MSWKPITIQYEDVDDYGAGFRITNYHRGHWDCIKNVTYVNSRGWPHNNNHAAITQYDVDGKVLEETWAREGVLYDINDLAAFIALSDEDKESMRQAISLEYIYYKKHEKCQDCQDIPRIASKTWHNMFGEKHRPGNKPAIISKNSCCQRNSMSGNPVIRAEWYVNDKQHRDDGGPTHLAKATKHNRSIPYFTVKQWHYEGKLHRVDGPSELQDRPNVSLTSWHLNGTQYGSFEEWLAENPLSLADKVELKLRY